MGGMDLSGLKLENSDSIRVESPRIGSSHVGTGGPRSDPDGSRAGLNGPKEWDGFFFQFHKKNKKPQKIIKTKKEVYHNF
jgi:hypothetical protein